MIAGRARRGVTLVELCVALVVLALVGTVVGSALLAGRRATVRETAGVERDATLRHAAATLSFELRSLYPHDSLVVADSALETTVAIATGVVCALDGRAVVLPPLAPAAGEPHARVAAPIAPGDVLLVLGDARPGDRWTAATVVHAAERRDPSLCAPPSGFTTIDDALRPRLRVELAALPADARVGAAVWVGRRVRWSLYRGADGWQLGRRECTRRPVVACTGVQPVAGPLRPHHRDPARTGLHVRRLDGRGVALAPGDTARAALLAVTLRAGDADRPDSATVWLPLDRP